MAGQVPQHRRPCIAKSAEHAGRDCLHTVEQLKDRSDKKKGHADREDHGIGRKRTNQDARNEETRRPNTT